MCVWGGEFELISKKKRKERKILSFEGKQKKGYVSFQECYVDETGVSTQH